MAKSQSSDWKAEHLGGEIYACASGDLRIKRRRDALKGKISRLKNKVELGEGSVEGANERIAVYEKMAAAMDAAVVAPPADDADE